MFPIACFPRPTPSPSDELAFLRTADGGYYLTADGGKIRITINH